MHILMYDVIRNKSWFQICKLLDVSTLLWEKAKGGPRMFHLKAKHYKKKSETTGVGALVFIWTLLMRAEKLPIVWRSLFLLCSALSITLLFKPLSNSDNGQGMWWGENETETWHMHNVNLVPCRCTRLDYSSSVFTEETIQYFMYHVMCLGAQEKWRASSRTSSPSRDLEDGCELANRGGTCAEDSGLVEFEAGDWRQ